MLFDRQVQKLRLGLTAGAFVYLQPIGLGRSSVPNGFPLEQSPIIARHRKA